MRHRNLDKSNEVFEFIQRFIDENGFAPSVRDICRECDIKSTASANNYIKELAERGLINKVNNKKRAISLKQNSITVPLIGTVAAGQPIFAVENYEGFYSLPNNVFSNEDLFMLNVQGDSMINVGIYENDKIIVKKQASADSGDIVVALVDDSATVKRLFFRDDKIILHPENNEMTDFIFDEVQILGKVVGLLRNI